MLSLELGIPIGELSRRITYREYLLYMEHFSVRLGVPERTEFYLMDLALRLHNIGSIRSSGFEYDLNKFKIKFGPQPKPTAEERERSLQQSKAGWKARLSPYKDR